MSKNKMLQALGEIDDRFIEEAAPTAKKRKTWRYWTAAAAACLVLVAGLLALPLLQDGDGRYKDIHIQGAELGMVLPWEAQTLNEQYTSMTFDGRKYVTRGLGIDASLLGSELGTCKATGYDVYTDQTHHQTFTVYAITGIQNEKLVALRMENAYYVFLEEGYAPPATLGQLMETYNLAENLPLTRFSHNDAYYLLEDCTAIWQILADCGDAPVVKDDDFRVTGEYLSFTATSEALGVYKRVFYVTADGYVKTNVLDYGYVYHIGQEAAGTIIDYALANATETEMEPYTNFVAGTITEIGDGYILVSDAILCKEEADGISYKILTNNPQFSRWLRYLDFQVGDVVYIQYRGEVTEENVIDSAYTISEAILSDGDLWIQE